MKTRKTTCSRKGCAELKAVSATGRTLPYCREHKRESNREWAAKNPEKCRNSFRRWLSKSEGRTYEEPSGYVKYLGFNHPACSPSGVTRYHRIVLWDKLDGMDAPCAECGRQLYWDASLIGDIRDALHVDHINGVRNDNRPENLDPICLTCNNVRERRRRSAA